MASWNEIKTNVGRAANKTVKKAGELADVASMHFKLKTTKAKINDRYEKLGRLTYKQLKTEISQAEAIAEVISELDALREEVRALKEKIEELKKERENSAESVDVENESTEEAAAEDTAAEESAAEEPEQE